MSFFNPGSGYEAAKKEFQKYFNQGIGYQSPYQQAGLNQQNILTGAENNLLDPSKMLANWINNYKESPTAQKATQNATESGLDAASAMGLSGSSTAVNNIQNSASDIMNKDESTYISNLMKQYMSGVGIGENIYGKGANAAQRMGYESMKEGEDMGKAAFGEENSKGQLLGNFMKFAAKAAMAMML